MTWMVEPFPLGVLEADSPLREEPFHFVGEEADSPWQVEPSLCAEWEGDNLEMVATSNCSDLVASNSWPAAHRRWTWKDEEGASIPWTEERKLRTSLNVGSAWRTDGEEGSHVMEEPVRTGEAWVLNDLVANIPWMAEHSWLCSHDGAVAWRDGVEDSPLMVGRTMALAFPCGSDQGPAGRVGCSLEKLVSGIGKTWQGGDSFELEIGSPEPWLALVRGTPELVGAWWSSWGAGR